MELKRYGTYYGGFWLPLDLKKYLSKDSIIYLVGVGEDISFDCLISGLFNIKVFMFDPTPRAIIHVNYIKDVLNKKVEPKHNKKFGGNDPNYFNIIQNSNCNPDNLIFNPLGLSTKNEKVKFYKPINPEYVSHSILPLGRSKNYIEVEVKTLKTLMEINNHKHIDFLKIDIENIECDVLEDMLNENILPKLLCVDFDLARHSHSGKQRVDEMIKKLTTQYNYKILKNTEYDISFLKN